MSKDLDLLVDFCRYVMTEATSDYSVSYRDGDPRETFWDAFNA